MKKIKRKGVVIIALILLVAIISLTYIFIFDNNTVTVGTANFIMPEGYKEDGISDFGAITITNGTNKIYLTESPNDITKDLDDYEKYLKDHNRSITVEKFSVYGATFYKTVETNNSDIVHYLFTKNGKTYCVSAFDGNPNLENIVMEFYNN